MFPAAPVCVEYSPADGMLSEIEQAFFFLENEIYTRTKELSNVFFLFVFLKCLPKSMKRYKNREIATVLFPTHNLSTSSLIIRHLVCLCLLFFFATVNVLVQTSSNTACVVSSSRFLMFLL